MGRHAPTTLSNLEFRIIDNNSPTYGVSLRRLMRNAALGVAEEVRRLSPKRVLVACGPGNNGGDGMALASILAQEMEVRLLLAEDPARLRQPEARWAFEGLDAGRTPFEVYRTKERVRELAREADLVVDALLGSGTQGALREPIRSIVNAINASRRPVLSIDVPTGYDSSPSVRPLVTVALHAKKEGMTRANSGRIVVRDIGVPAEAIDRVGPADFFVPYPRNRPDSHKGQNGRLLIVAGGPYTGAPLLSASSALRTGIDLVRLVTPQDAARAAQSRLPDLIVHAGREPDRLVQEDVQTVRRLLPRVDAILVGPGVGEGDETLATIERILREAASAGTRVVLDADAIQVAGRHPGLVRRLRPLVTPHHGEFKELTGKSVPKTMEGAKAVVAAQARRLGATLLVKGPTDILADGRRLKTNHIHHPGMTTGGTGDVLAGLCGGFVAKGMDPFHAACAAAFVNGEAGRRAARRQGGTLLATDLVRQIPRVFKAWLR